MPTATADQVSASPFIAPPAATPSASTARDTKLGKSKVVLVGFDLGTNKSCVLAGPPGSTDITVSKVVPSVVGYVKDGIVDGIIAGNKSVLFGEEAINATL